MSTALTPNRFVAALWLGALLMLAALALPAAAAPDFPALTGRVVDNAELLSPAQEQALIERLAAERGQCFPEDQAPLGQRRQHRQGRRGATRWRRQRRESQR